MLAPHPSAIGHAIRGALHWVSQHSGVPILICAAIAIVLSWRVLKWSVRFVLEVVVALALLLVGTHLGWISW